jgi:hypothetical protein
VTQKTATWWCRSDTATRSIKDSYSDQMLKLTNAATQGRLPNKQNFRSPTKTALICRDDGASQLGKVNSRYPALEFHFAKSSFVNNFEMSSNAVRGRVKTRSFARMTRIKGDGNNSAL